MMASVSADSKHHELQAENKEQNGIVHSFEISKLPSVT